VLAADGTVTFLRRPAIAREIGDRPDEAGMVRPEAAAEGNLEQVSRGPEAKYEEIVRRVGLSVLAWRRLKAVEDTHNGEH